jgi:hypothetical protein
MRVDPEIRRFLEALPTLCVGQAEDLKVETALCRVWMNRVLPGQVEIEIYTYDEASNPGDEHRPRVWEISTGRLARDFANEALRIAGYAGTVKI